MKLGKGMMGFLVGTACLWVGVVATYAVQVQSDAGRSGSKLIPMQVPTSCSSSSSGNKEN